jgi:hypothetical protein
VAPLPRVPSANAPSSWTPVVVSAQENDHVIVRLNAIAIGKRGADAARRRRGANAEVHGDRRVPHEHIGGVLGRCAINGGVARKPGQHGRLLPDGFAQTAIDIDRLIDPRRLDIE